MVSKVIATSLENDEVVGIWLLSHFLKMCITGSLLINTGCSHFVHQIYLALPGLKLYRFIFLAGLVLMVGSIHHNPNIHLSFLRKNLNGWGRQNDTHRCFKSVISQNFVTVLRSL